MSNNMNSDLGSEDAQLKRRVTDIVLSRRHSLVSSHPKAERHSYEDEYSLAGMTLRRLTVIMNSRGCSVPTCTMCPFTNYNLYGTEVQPMDPVAQLKSRLAMCSNMPELVALYNDGSFFADREVSSTQRTAIAVTLRATGIKHLMVESLPQFIANDKLRTFADTFGGQITIGVGLQSSDAFVREICAGTSFSLMQFEKARDTIFHTGHRLKVYIMLKPPFLSEAHAYSDVVSTVKYLRSEGEAEVTVCPTRIAPNTLAHDLHTAELYTPPHPFTILLTMKRICEMIDARIAMANLMQDDFPSITSMSLRHEIANITLSALRRYGKSRNLDDLTPVSELKRMCEHARALERAPPGRATLRDTVSSQLSVLERRHQWR